MKSKKIKRLTAIAAAALAVCMAITAFALWSSNITVNGSVSAKGNWSVKVTDAQVELSSAGAELLTETSYDVVVYPIQMRYIESTGYYIYAIDDTDPKTVSVTADEFGEYSNQVMIPVGANYYVSCTKPDSIHSFMIKPNDNFSVYKPEKAQDGGAANGIQVGEAIAWACMGQLTHTKDESGLVALTYGAAKEYFESNSALPSVTINDNNAEFACVHFSLPKAWASYSVTVTNEGSVNANLSDYTIVTSELDDIFTVSVPEDMDDDTLAPGESCTFNIVVQVNAEGDFEAQADPFSISLTYEQDAVNEAPAAAHTH